VRIRTAIAKTTRGIHTPVAWVALLTAVAMVTHCAAPRAGGIPDNPKPKTVERADRAGRCAPCASCLPCTCDNEQKSRASRVPHGTEWPSTSPASLESGSAEGDHPGVMRRARGRIAGGNIHRRIGGPVWRTSDQLLEAHATTRGPDGHWVLVSWGTDELGWLSVPDARAVAAIAPR